MDEDVRAEEAGVDEDNPLGRPGRPMNRRSPFRVGFAGTVGAGLAYLLYQALVNARSVLVLVLVAAFLAIGLNPTVSRLERMGLRRGGAVAIVFLGVLVLLRRRSATRCCRRSSTRSPTSSRRVPGYVRNLQDNRDDPRPGPPLRAGGAAQRVRDRRASAPRSPATSSHRARGWPALVFKALTILILTLYFLSSFNTIKDTAYRLVPRTRRARVTLIGDEILGRVGGYVAGAVVVALIAGSATLVWVSALGIPYPLALALIVTITDIIPLIGATRSARSS